MKTKHPITLSYFIVLSIVGITTLFLPQVSYSRDLETNCTFTREYITTLEYLRKQSILAIPEPDARKISLQVSRGCTGAAQRFIKITTALRGANVGAMDSIRTGIEFASRTDIETETFNTVFLVAYLEEYLDLDLRSSLKLARSLSTEFQGDILGVRDDFETLVQFCVGTKELNLPRAQCGTFAARIAHYGEKFSGGVAPSFIELFSFLYSESGPRLTTGQALKLAETLIHGGKDSAENFIQAYKFGVAPLGLGDDIPTAIHFAEQMAFPSR